MKKLYSSKNIEINCLYKQEKRTNTRRNVPSQKFHISERFLLSKDSSWSPCRNVSIYVIITEKKILRHLNRILSDNYLRFFYFSSSFKRVAPEWEFFKISLLYFLRFLFFLIYSLSWIPAMIRHAEFDQSNRKKG